MTLPYQGVSRIEFHVCCLWIPVVGQGVDCFYSVGRFDALHDQDRLCAPCIFVDYFHHVRPELVRFTTKQDVSNLSLHLVSQDSARELFNLLMILPYQGE
jgi:hypothetical protein